MNQKPSTSSEGEKRGAAPVLHTRNRIPWYVHKRAWDQYARLGFGDQSAEQVADRGGFAWPELVVLLTGGDPFRPGDVYAHLCDPGDPDA